MWSSDNKKGGLSGHVSEEVGLQSRLDQERQRVAVPVGFWKVKIG